MITDLFVREKDGLEVVRSLTKHGPDIKIIDGSADGRKDVLEVLEDFGVCKTFGE